MPAQEAETVATTVSILRLAGTIVLVSCCQVETSTQTSDDGRKPGSLRAPGQMEPMDQPIDGSGVLEAEVAAANLDVFDQPDDRAYVAGRLQRGDRVRVRAGRSPGTGWLAIDPPSTTICWIEEASLEFEVDNDKAPD